MSLSKKQLIIELFMPVLMIAVSVYFIAASVPMGGEGTFPMICGVLQLITSIYLLVKVLLKRDVVVKLEGLNVKKAFFTVVALVIYVLVMEKIGYCLSTFLLVAFVIWFLGYKNWKIILLCSVLTVAATYLIFGVLLHVPLPMLFFN